MQVMHTHAHAPADVACVGGLPRLQVGVVEVDHAPPLRLWLGVRARHLIRRQLQQPQPAGDAAAGAAAHRGGEGRGATRGERERICARGAAASAAANALVVGAPPRAELSHELLLVFWRELALILLHPHLGVLAVEAHQDQA